jgi:hypothetical protein
MSRFGRMPLAFVQGRLQFSRKLKQTLGRLLSLDLPQQKVDILQLI